MEAARTLNDAAADILRDYPFLQEEDTRAALLYAARRLANEAVYAA